MRVLYVGGSGYVGRLVVPLLRQRFAVRVFDLRPPDGNGEYAPGDATGHAAVLAALAGVDATQFVRTPGGWRITSMVWDDEA
jgi:uncharacterized protein YbjT (DUF2867 family)